MPLRARGERASKNRGVDPDFTSAYLQACILFERQGRETDILAANLNLQRLPYRKRPVAGASRCGRAKEEWVVTGESRSNSCGSRQDRRGFLPWTFAMAYIRMGDKDRAME